VNHALFPALLVSFVTALALAKSVAAGTVTFVSPCECQAEKSGSRWTAKTDPSPVPLDKSAVQSITPSQIYKWKGPEANVPLTTETERRIASEQKWYNLTGRVVGLKVEADGDITLALKDASGNRVGTVGAEIPVGPTWCEIRRTVFGWTMQSFPFSFKASERLEIREQHVITVTGKAFYDIAHAPKDQSNRRSHLPGYTAWEIHPVMKLEIQ
jgi:hypothetical protein